MLEIVDCLNDHFQILGVASGNKDEDYEHLWILIKQETFIDNLYVNVIYAIKFFAISVYINSKASLIAIQSKY
jgi:hypothetical protein